MHKHFILQGITSFHPHYHEDAALRLTTPPVHTLLIHSE